MKPVFPRRLSASALILTLAACTSPGAVIETPTPTSVPIAVDLGASLRIPRIAGLAGEGEGYGTAQAKRAPIAHGSMPGMNSGSTPGMSHAASGSAPAPQAGQTQAEGTGTINSVDLAGHRVNLNHKAIPAIGWPAMTMDFAVAPSVNLRAVKPGTRVNFMMEQGSDGIYVIQSFTPVGGER